MTVRIGVDLGGTKIEIAALDPVGKILFRHRIPTPRDDYAATVSAIAGAIADVKSHLSLADVSIGIGTPGSPSPMTGRMRNCNSTWLNDRPLPEDLSQALGQSIRLANDADCFTLSEAVDGAGHDARVVFGVILGTGVGGGIVVEKKLLSGPNRIAGEWGHNPLPYPSDGERPGPSCYCGRSGCIETFLSGPALSLNHRQATGLTIDAQDIAREARNGDPAAQATLRRYMDRLARSLAGVINILDPDIIILGGGLSQIDTIYETVPSLWGRYIFSDCVRTKLSPPVHGDASGVRGAAWLWPPDES